MMQPSEEEKIKKKKPAGDNCVKDGLESIICCNMNTIIGGKH